MSNVLKSKQENILSTSHTVTFIKHAENIIGNIAGEKGTKNKSSINVAVLLNYYQK